MRHIPALLFACVLVFVGLQNALAADAAKDDAPEKWPERRHSAVDLSIRVPTDWAYHEQPFRRQNDVLIGLFPPGQAPSDPLATRVYVHAHALPAGITFDHFVQGHERAEKMRAGRTIERSEATTFNDLPAHRWVTKGPEAGKERNEMILAACKGQTVYFAIYRGEPAAYDQFADVAEKVIQTLKIGKPATLPAAKEDALPFGAQPPTAAPLRRRSAAPIV